MVSIKAISSSVGAAAYFERSQTREGYYNRERSGQWIGKSCAAVGVKEGAVVDLEHFKNILDGKSASGELLLKAGGQGQTHRSGWDITFSPDPSFAAFAATSADAAVLAEKWHKAGAGDVLKHIESELVQARVTTEGVTERVNTCNMIAAAFDHQTTRPVNGEPVVGMHTHVVVCNITVTEKGLRAIANEKLLDRDHLIAIYENGIAAAAVRDGYSASMFRPEGARGRSLYARLDGVPEAAREAISLRSAQIAERAETLRAELKAKYPGRDFSESEIRAMACVDSREAARSFSEAEVGAAFDRQQAAAGQSRETIAAGVETARSREAGQRREAVDIVRLAISKNNLTEARAVFGLPDVLTTASELSKGERSLPELQKAINKLTKSGEIVQLDRETMTTREMLETEQRITERIEAGKGAMQPIAARSDVEKFLSEKYSFLSVEQREAVIAPLCGTDRYNACRGVAGAGKSTLAKAINEYAAGKGVTVEGSAFMATAGQNLEAKSGIASGTIHRALMRESFTPGSLQVVDEYSQLGTMQAAKLMEKAEAAGARVLFLGDDRQLTSQAAGAPISAAVRDCKIATTEITQSQRQKTPEMREIAGALHKKDVTGAFVAMQKSDCIRVSSGERAAARREVIDLYFERARGGRDVQIYTPLHKDREAINEEIRERRKEHGELNGGYRVTVREPSGLRGAQRHHSANYEIGDKVFVSAKVGEIKRGSTLEITGIDHQRNTLLTADRRGEPHSVSLSTYGQNLSAYHEKEIEIAAGDKVVFLKNDSGEKGVNVTNKMTGTVTEMRADRMTVKTDSGERIVPLDRYNYVTHGYAQTVTGAQGQDAAHAIAYLPVQQRELDTMLAKDLTNTFNQLTVAGTRMETGLDLVTNNPRELMELCRREQVKEQATDYLKEQKSEDRGKEKEDQGTEKGRTNPERLRKEAGEVRKLIGEMQPGEFTAQDVHALRGPASKLTPEQTDRALYILAQRGEIKLTDSRDMAAHKYEQQDRTKTAICEALKEAKEQGVRHVTPAQLIDSVKAQDETINERMIEKKIAEMDKAREIKTKDTDDGRQIIATGAKPERDKDKEKEIIAATVWDRAESGQPFTVKDVRGDLRELGIASGAAVVKEAIETERQAGALVAETVRANGKDQTVFFGKEATGTELETNIEKVPLSFVPTATYIDVEVSLSTAIGEGEPTKATADALELSGDGLELER